MIIEINLISWGKALVWAILTMALNFIMPLGDFIVTMTALVVCDLYTGTRAARHRGELIHSRGLRRTIEKIVLYFIAITLSHLIEVTLLDKKLSEALTWTVTSIIAMTEFKSNLENISQVTGTKLWLRLIEAIPSLKDLLKRKNDKDDA
jgi:phage-related holin